MFTINALYQLHHIVVRGEILRFLPKPHRSTKLIRRWLGISSGPVRPAHALVHASKCGNWEGQARHLLTGLFEFIACLLAEGQCMGWKVAHRGKEEAAREQPS